MIQATVRHHLTRDDAQLVARLIWRATADSRSKSSSVALADEGIDAVLDDPRLPAALMRAGQGACASLPLFLYVMVRHALRRRRRGRSPSRRLRRRDADALRHARQRATHQCGRRPGVRLARRRSPPTWTIPMRGAASSCARTSATTRCGSAGCFPITSSTVGGAAAVRTSTTTRRWAGAASSSRPITGSRRTTGLTTLYATAAERFGLLRAALNDVSDSLLFPDRYSPERLMRQVSVEARWRRLS